jgi:hypothetical protein
MTVSETSGSNALFTRLMAREHFIARTEEFQQFQSICGLVGTVLHSQRSRLSQCGVFSQIMSCGGRETAVAM